MSETTQHRLIAELQAKRQRHRQRALPYRVLFAALGFLITFGGVAMLLLPGPAFVVIPLGLAMLALEFSWAERLLGRALEQAEKAKRTAAQTSGKQKLIVAALVLVLAAGVTAAIALWGFPPLPPFIAGD